MAAFATSLWIAKAKFIFKYFLRPKIKGACILCDTFDPDEKVCNDLFTIFLIAPGV